MLGIIMVVALLAQSPPGQPEKGPGGKEYAHREVRVSNYGKGGERFWIYEPGAPTPEKAPLILFLHGWGAMNPRGYEAWLRHMVRRGNVVVYPAYQGSFAEPPENFLPNVVKSLKRALAELREDGRVAPDLDNFAVVGHSAGGALSGDFAVAAKEEGLPVPKAVMSVQPARGLRKGGRRLSEPDYGKLPGNLLLLCVAGRDDTVAADAEAKRMCREATAIPARNRNLVYVHTDNHGQPPLSSDHFSPAAGSFLAPNAIDFYAYWKLFDALCDAAFYGKNREYALGNTPEQRFMGQWSDGTPVKPLEVITDPASLRH